MTAHATEATVVSSRDQALTLVRHVIETLDQRELEPFVLGMTTKAHEAALSAMAVAQEEPDLFNQFLVLCELVGFLSEDECDAFARERLEARRRRAA